MHAQAAELLTLCETQQVPKTQTGQRRAVQHVVAVSAEAQWKLRQRPQMKGSGKESSKGLNVVCPICQSTPFDLRSTSNPFPAHDHCCFINCARQEIVRATSDCMFIAVPGNRSDQNDWRVQQHRDQHCWSHVS
jgi:hypothetical protein